MATNLKLSQYVVTSDVLNVERTGFSGRLFFSTRSGQIISLNRSACAAIETQKFNDLSQEIRSKLIDAQILVPEKDDELKAILDENAYAIKNNDVLYQVVQPTAWCQLDCTYCGQEHSKSALSQANQEEFLRRTSQRLSTGNYRHLKIGWFGSEPLAGLTVIRSLSRKLLVQCRSFNCTYAARIVTNGLLLTPTLASELVRNYSVKEAEITIDGLAEHHDKQRFSKSKQGSFERIFSNLISVAKETEMSLVVRCNVSKLNSNGVAPLIERLASEGLSKLIRFYTSPVYSWGNDAHETSLNSEDYANMEMEWLALQLRLGFNVGLVPPRRRIVCMAVQREAEVLDAYGAIFNCTEVPYVPTYGQPNLYELTVPISELDSSKHESLAPYKLRHFNEQIANGNQKQCASCKMLPVCGGQCPKAWTENLEPCPSAKQNMRDRLNVLFATGIMP